jgi:hypothetical protein
VIGIRGRLRCRIFASKAIEQPACESEDSASSVIRLDSLCGGGLLGGMRCERLRIVAEMRLSEVGSGGMLHSGRNADRVRMCGMTERERCRLTMWSGEIRRTMLCCVSTVVS